MKKADIILSSNCVFTGVQDEPIQASIAITKNKISAIGTKEEMELFIGENTQIYDLKDELILPGFHDFHLHLMMGSIIENESVHLFGSQSAEEAAVKVAKFSETRKDNEWIIGIGWDHTLWENQELPHRTILDKYISNRPVLLFNAEVHFAWINSKAIEVIHISKDTPDPEYGEIGKDTRGELTGILFEQAIGFATKFAYRFSKQKRTELFQKFLKSAARYGVTSVNDLFAAKISPNQLEDLDVYAEFDKRGLLTTRIHFSPELKMDLEEARYLQKNYQSDKLTFSGLKQFIDGVVTGHTAFLLEPYNDRPETRGEPTLSPETIEKLVSLADKEGFQIRFHAIGNAAIRLALNAFEKARKENGVRDSRHVIEHIEVLHPDDLKRFKDLGVIASVQPYHVALLEKGAYLKKIGEDRKQLFYPMKSLLNEGAVVTLGTDFPVVSLNPMLGIYNALTRKDAAGEPWEKGESITLAEALRYYTLTPAYGSFREHELGTIEVGKLADIIVLNKNLFAIPTEEIPKTEVKMTIMDGKIVYEYGSSDAHNKY